MSQASSPKILFQDARMVAVHKPMGWVVYESEAHGAPSSQKDLERKLKKKVYPVHRLDKETEGVLLFALSPMVASDLVRSFKERKVKKVYLAIIWGKLMGMGSIRTPLKKHKSKEVQSALTQFEVIKNGKWENQDVTVVRLQPKTGRYHQIRRHLSEKGHPIMGDFMYGESKFNQASAEKNGIPHMMLLAEELQVMLRKSKIRIQARPGRAMRKALEMIQRS